MLLLGWDMGTVRDMFGGVSRFKGGVRCKGWDNSVIINVITEVNYRSMVPKKDQWFQKRDGDACSCIYLYTVGLFQCSVHLFEQIFYGSITSCTERGCKDFD